VAQFLGASRVCVYLGRERRAPRRGSVHRSTRVPYRDTESRAEGAQRAARGHRVLIGQGALEIDDTLREVKSIV
jgi:hypothetical protein